MSLHIITFISFFIISWMGGRWGLGRVFRRYSWFSAWGLCTVALKGQAVPEMKPGPYACKACTSPLELVSFLNLGDVQFSVRATMYLFFYLRILSFLLLCSLLLSLSLRCCILTILCFSCFVMFSPTLF